MTEAWRAELDGFFGDEPFHVEPLAGGCVGQVMLVTLPRSVRKVAKLDASGGGSLRVEAQMLEFLRANSKLRVPAVDFVSNHLLLMEWLPGRTGCGASAESHAAELLAKLHAVRAERFGFEFTTRIGGLEQPNEWSDSWLEFFAERRLLHMAREAFDQGRIDRRTRGLVERVAGRLDSWLEEPAAPALLHGDVWSGNLLTEGGRVIGFIDPAIYFGHPEVELAFTTLFSTFGDPFFIAYGARTSRIDADFFETRRHIYNIYPLLVHVRLFGGSYVGDLREVLGRFA